MKKNIDMLHGSLPKGILKYTIPIILTSVLQLLFNAADLVVVGRFCGSICVGAVSATGSLTNLLVNLFIGLSTGAGVTVAHGLGGRNDATVHKTVHTALPLALISGVFLTIIGISLSPTLLKWMDTPANVLPLSSLYMRIYFCGITFTIVYNFCASILRAAGDTKSPLVYLTTAGVINVILNVIFVAVFDMTVDGVALATTVSQGVSAILVFVALMRRTDACRLFPKKMRFYKKQLQKILRIGLPAGVQSSLFAISNVIIQSSINSFNSDAVLSGNGASQNIEGFIYVIMNSFHQAAVNYIGQNAGAHKFSRIKKSYLYSLLYVTIFGCITGFLAWFFGKELLGIYITDSTDAIQYGITRLTYIALPYFVCGLMDVTTGALRGLGASVAPMIISVAGVCGIRIIWIYTVFQITEFHTLESLFISYLFSWTFTFLVEAITFFVVYNKNAQKDLIYQRALHLKH